ncbi:MAG: ATP-dependent DNA helicase RecG [Oscillospiraceae bacterium]|nr:ATP-dependent DNA helicase RecG [Oscillospiraceae bacterium]
MSASVFEAPEDMNQLSRDIKYLKGVGERRAGQFARLGVTTVGALLRYYPRDYTDYTKAYTISEAPLSEPCAVAARVAKKLPAARISGGRTLYRVLAEDGEADLNLVWFNNKYAPASLKEGGDYVFYGKLAGGLLAREMTNPLVVKREEMGTLAPLYQLTEGLSSRIIANCVKNALSLASKDLRETLPEELRSEFELPGITEATENIHFPKNREQALKARRRFIFEELLTLSLGLALLRSKSRASTSAKLSSEGLESFISKLPFELTAAQRRSIDEIAKDLGSGCPMNRLLQGDVGSGKTVCAAAAVYCAAESGWQSAVMAPTEILARQHADTFERLLSPLGLKVGLLTGALRGRARTVLLERLAAGEIDLVVGTQAVIGEGVAFKKLGLVVADEQHRFGVEQRSALLQKGERPHLLVMSATPIPRTLSLIIYGDLDISIIDELPPGRKRVKTRLVSSDLRPRYLGFVKKLAEEGAQSYIVCPLVEDSEGAGELKSALEYKEELEKGYLSGLEIGLLHGRMKPKEKEAVMKSFAEGETQALVSTTVIEVGVDVPNAALMIIETAERFGLSALHQLRGRVGRGERESWCVLVSDTKSESAKERLKVLTSTSDGFEIARADLKARGPGDFLGRRQHGLPALGIADLAADEQLLHAAQRAAAGLLERDEGLKKPEHAALRARTEEIFSESAALN